MEAAMAVEHDGDGVVIETKPARPVPPSRHKGRPRAPVSPDQMAAAAEAERVREERVDLRRAELATFQVIDPAHEVEGDPPVQRIRPARLHGEPKNVLLELPRVSGRGLPGSKLVIAGREYDGNGNNGAPARKYALLFVRFNNGAGYPYRTVGCSVYRDELRAVAKTLSELADELDAEDRAAEGSPADEKTAIGEPRRTVDADGGSTDGSS
jgi:hypothetical protein